MRDLKWGRVLSVDIDEIDDDHKKLVDLFNMLNHALSDGESREYLKAVLEELINCTVWHFSHEERLMVKYDYPEYQLHKEEHRELVESAREVQVKILKADVVITDDDVEFLERWLTEHILTLDMRLGAYLCQTM